MQGGWCLGFFLLEETTQQRVVHRLEEEDQAVEVHLTVVNNSPQVHVINCFMLNCSYVCQYRNHCIHDENGILQK